MVPPEGSRIIDSVAEGRYEEALGVVYGARRCDVNRNHLALLHTFRDHAAVRVALNRAKSGLAVEGPIERGERLARLGRYAEALPGLRRAVKLRGEHEDHLGLGKALVGLERFEEALPHLLLAARERGRALDHHWLGTCLFHMKRYAEAMAPLENAVDLGHDVLDEEMLATARRRVGRNRDLVGRLAALVTALCGALVGR
jgi:tetratricopeptide (TPR) repeat protein